MNEIQQRIIELKEKNDACILAHCYQTHDILEIADYVGDSFGLAQKAAVAKNKTIIMCGVRFMAETVKILSPEKRVLIPREEAGCPMAEQLDPDMLLQLKQKYPDHKVVAYINTTAELKTLCDVCVTSSSAVKIIKKLDSDNILFIPDCNLGDYVKKQVPEKKIKLISGGCPTHAKLTAAEAKAAKAAHPGALFLVHPECQPEVVALADFVGSTTEIMDFAAKSDAEEFIIGTENSIVQHLGIQHPEKLFHPLSKDCVCHNMKVTTIADVLHTLEGRSGFEITMDEEQRLAAKKCIDEMLRLGNG
ncbi:MAG: quinolinate synthase NadA [Oscillospiraceae bacterium]|nr:quinolinate synthase NadA [Oscillospiraceae bacterium]